MNVKSIAGVVRASSEKRIFVGANAMRSFLAFGLLIILCASASAATVHRLRHDVIVRADQGYAKIGFALHTNYHGSAVHHQPMHGLGKFWRGVGYHAYDPHCSMSEESKYPPWSFC